MKGRKIEGEGTYHGRLCKSTIDHTLGEGHGPCTMSRRRLPILRIDRRLKSGQGRLYRVGQCICEQIEIKRKKNLEFHDLLHAIARLAHSVHFLVECAHAPTDPFRRARGDGYLARERGRLGVQVIDAGDEGPEAGEGGEDRLLVGEERRERVGQFGLFGLERGERGEDLRERCQRRRVWTECLGYGWSG